MANLKNEHVLEANQTRHEHVMLRRHTLLDLLERNYGIPLTKKEIAAYLEEQGFTGTGRNSLELDFRNLNIIPISAQVGGRNVRFYAQVSHVPPNSPEDIRSHVTAKTIENEAIKEMMRCAIDVFLDGKRVVITTIYERAKHLAMWLRNLPWPEIWYLAKEDGSTVIIEAKSEERAAFLRRRLWGLKLNEEIVGMGGEKDE